MYKIKYIILISLFTSLYANTITNRYPSYHFVLSQFGVNSDYIYDSSFIDFIDKKEKSLIKFYKNSIKRGQTYIPIFKNMLRDDGLSEQFIYISMVESGFNPNIISSKKAVGMWQFMPTTARNYNLNVNHYIDERYNPISSTTAAIKYLKKLKRDFGKWYLAVMAYNCGEGRVAKAIKKAGSDDITTLLNKDKRYIPKETIDYVKKILLLSMIGENQSTTIFTNYLQEDTIINYDDEGVAEVFVKKHTNLSILAQIIGVDIDILSKMNSHIKNQDSLEEEITNILIPIEKLPQFYLLYDIENEEEENLNNNIDILETKSKDDYFISYVVESNLSIESLANEYNLTMGDICKVNGFLKTDLTIGEVILIPTSKELFNSLVK